MKLLFYIHAIVGGGAERVLSTLVNELADYGHEIHLATNVHSKFVYPIDKRVILHDLYKGWDSCSNKTIRSILLRKNIRSIAKGIRPNAIIAFLSSMGCRVIFSTLGLAIPVVVSEHTNVSRNFGKIFNIKRNILYTFANAITVLTRHDKAIWQKKKSNVVYMPNLIDYEENYKYSTKDRQKVVLAVGRVNEWKIKGFDNLLKCWGQLCHNFPDWKLQIAGSVDDDTRSFLTRLAEENNCINYEFLGFRSDVDVLMSQSEIFCLSSRIEGLPMALIEAMHSGCCCVSFDVITGPNEIINNNVNGLIAENQNNNDLIAKIKTVLEDSDLRHSLARNAHIGVEKFSTKRIAQRWIILLNKIVRKEAIL